ncbi:MAG: hypothetical protein WBH20_12180, partial [Oceanisphaera sp.]|uniref:hypothetical protein n=1 Tax=Oceanisphaera sp. TaxID=1929979 RepID=UPI003C72AB9B
SAMKSGYLFGTVSDSRWAYLDLDSTSLLLKSQRVIYHYSLLLISIRGLGLTGKTCSDFSSIFSVLFRSRRKETWQRAL